MLEMYLRLCEARAISYMAIPNSGLLSRDSVINAATVAKHRHPLGDRMILAEMGDQHSITELADWAKGILPALHQEVVMVALGHPLQDQLEYLIKVSPRYVRAIKKARALQSEAAHEHRLGNHHRAGELELEADRMTQVEHEHSKASILSNGRCPRCRGTGRMDRKNESCPICGGSGTVIPSLKVVLEKHGQEVYAQFIHLVDVMQIDKSDWLRLFRRQIAAEKAA